MDIDTRKAGDLAIELKRAQSALAESVETLSREVKARAAERAGRVRAERALREVELKLLTSAESASRNEDHAVGMATSSRLYPLATLGTFSSSFSRRNGCPRQPHLVKMARGRVNLHAHIPNAALEGLEEFSHVWLIYLFHANTDLQQTVGAGAAGQDQKRSTARAKVRVPRLNGGKRGVLATRTPHRPAPVGLSLAAIRAVDVINGVLELGGADLVDGTPILDIKPYLPFCDAPPADGAAPFAPEWVAVDSSLPEGEPLKLATVSWAPEARRSVIDVWESRGGAKRSLYDNADDLLLFVEEALARDIRSAHQRKKDTRFSETLVGAEEVLGNVPSEKSDDVAGAEEADVIGDTRCNDIPKWQVVLDGILIHYDILPGGEVFIAGYLPLKDGENTS